MCEVGAEGGVEGALKEEVCHVFFGSRAMGAAQGMCPSGSGCLAGGGGACGAKPVTGWGLWEGRV